MSLSILYYGDRRLRKKAAPVEKVTEEVRSFADQLIQKMLEVNGIGLAATQVGVMLRMFSSVIYEDGPGGEITYGEPYVVINPFIRRLSEELCEMNEACLSIPELEAGPVPRSFSIEVEFRDLEWNLVRRELKGFLARNWMHEIDHLDGILFIDRIKGKARRALEPELRRIKNTYVNPTS